MANIKIVFPVVDLEKLKRLKKRKIIRNNIAKLIVAGSLGLGAFEIYDTTLKNKVAHDSTEFSNEETSHKTLVKVI